MALLLKKSIQTSTQLGIWKIEEDEQFFKQHLFIDSADRHRLDNMHERRRREWLAGRLLINKLHPSQANCMVDPFGKPYLPDTPIQISISHSKDYAAVISDQNSVGIDIEKVSSRIRRIAHKFMREEESQSLSTIHPDEHLHIFWGAKEALYKAYGKKKLDFRKHLHIEPFQYQQKGHTLGLVTKGNYQAKFDIYFEKMGGYMLVYCIEKN